MITLYGSVISFINLLFGYINYAFADTLTDAYYYSNPYDTGISYWMSAFIIFGAATIILLRVIHTTIHHDPTRADIWVRRWALYFTLFVAGLTVLGDLIALLHAFLAGDDLTTRFLLKVAVVLLVASGAFMHFLADLKGYWAAQPKRANAITVAVSLLGILAIAAGFLIIGSPAQARHYRIDQQRVNDLQSLQSQVISFYQSKQVLPTTLMQLEDPILYYNVPVDPETGASYEYTKTADLGFQVCATFSAPTPGNAQAMNVPTMPARFGIKGQDNWQHVAGHVCFTRTIDPDFFPPINKPTSVQ